MWRGTKHISKAGRRTGVRIKTRPPKEGINGIDNKEAYKLILYIHSNGSSNIDQKSSYRVGRKYIYCCVSVKTKGKEELYSECCTPY
jgi:hypothetical protein